MSGRSIAAGAWLAVLAAAAVSPATGNGPPVPTAQGVAVNNPASLAPRTIGPFEAVGPDAAYDRKTLYDYMDGGAEVFLAFDFRRVFVRRYKAPSGDEITLDVYEMGSPAEAFGIFSLDRPPGVEEAGIGQESQFGFGLLKAWQGRHFVSVMTSAEAGPADKALLELGRAVVAKLGPPGALPDLLALLPAAGLKKGRTSYFHAPVHLHNRFFVAADNILGLDEKTEAAVAEYDAGPGETISLLLVRYPDEARAEAAAGTFLRSFLAGADDTGAALTESRKWTQARRAGRLLAVVFDAPSKARAEALLSRIKFPPS